jgi:hypothetical protein
MQTEDCVLTDPAVREAPADGLERLERLAGMLGAARVARDARSLAERLAAGRFYVACIGQFKRGKSTLLNALVDEAVLPTGVVPVTAVPTVLRYGERRSAVVRTRTGAFDVALDDVAAFVAEENNPANAKGVEAVEILLPAPILGGGLCLVDTPGLGSVFEVATEATHAFVPHIDAALVVVGADPPISADEQALVQAVAGQVRDIVVVLTKSDRTSADERAAAIAFTRRVLAESLGRPVDRIYEVSARERRDVGPTRHWNDLVASLQELAEGSGARLVRTARQRGIGRMSAMLRARLTQERESLLRPIEESERRLRMLDASSDRIDQRLRYLGHMLTAEQERVSEALLERQERFLAGSLAAAMADVDREVGRAKGWGPGVRRRIARFIREMTRGLVEPWLAGEEEVAGAMYGEVAERFVDVANAFLEELESVADVELDRVSDAAVPEPDLDGASRFYFDPLPTDFVSTLPFQALADTLSPRPWLRHRLRKQGRAFAEQLLKRNATRVRNDLDQRVAESRRRLEGEVRTILSDARAWAEAMIARTRTAQAAGTEAVQAELDRLADAEAELEAIESL